MRKKSSDISSETHLLVKFCQNVIAKLYPLPQGARYDISCAKRTVKNLSLFTSHFSREGKRYAFTLAETLITLGIIGVVASLTIAPLIKKYRAKVLSTSFKKSYSVLYNSYLMTKSSLGIDDLRKTYAYYDYSVKRYVNAQEFYDEFYKQLKVVKVLSGYNYKNYNKSYENIVSKSGNCGSGCPHTIRLLPDGSTMGTFINSNTIFLDIDTNGQKGPNRYGFDIFTFEVDANDRVAPIKQYKLYTEEELKKFTSPGYAGKPCSIKSNQYANGVGCSWYAINDINPDDETKKYWDNLPW